MTEKKEAPAAEELDGIPENIQKRLHVISFTAKWLIIGVVAFFAIQLAFRIFLVNPDEENGVNADTLHHNYCGTFFVTNTVENTYISADAYEKYSAATAAEKGRGVKGIADGIVSAVGIPAVIICIFIALYNTDKNRLFLKHASRWFLVSGLLWAAVNVYAEVSNYLSVQKELPFLVGVPATTRYYCQLYNVLGIPAADCPLRAYSASARTLNARHKARKRIKAAESFRCSVRYGVVRFSDLSALYKNKRTDYVF